MPPLSKSELEAVVAWFALASVVLSDAAVKILNDEGVSTEVLLLLFEQTGDSAARMQSRLMSDFGFDYISALRISTGVARRCGQSDPAELAALHSSGAAAASSSAFVNMFDDALAEGATSPPASSEARRKRAEELADKAAQEATENEGNAVVVFLVMWFGVRRVRYAMRDKRLLERLQSKAVGSEESATGVWNKHVKSREKFDAFLNKAMEYFTSLHLFGAVQRITEWRAKLPPSWTVAKLYIEFYMDEYGGNFPVACDTQLLVRASTESASHMDSKLERFDQVEALIKDLKSIKAGMKDGNAAHKANPRKHKIAHCYKCGDMDHMADVCPITDKKEAKRLRKVNNAVRFKLERESSDEGGSSSSSD